MTKVVDMDHRAAWRDFYDLFLPSIWSGLSRKDRQAVNTAERDYWEKRLDRSGQAVRLGVDRVEGLLGRLAPGRYVVERRVVFRVVDDGELSPPDNPG